MGWLRKLKCAIGMHEREVTFPEREVKCVYCETRNKDLELIKLGFEIRAWERVRAGEWPYSFAKDYVENSLWVERP